MPEYNSYLISYIEDNDLGVYPKEVLEQGPNFSYMVELCNDKYPTVFGIKQMFGEIAENWRNYYTHESQDLLRRSQLQMEIDINAMFPEESREAQ